MKEYSIRRMTKSEVPIALEWAQKEGWNPGINDSMCFYQADPKGFFVGLLDGEPIATGAAVAYDENFGFCGLYIVKAGYRHQGFGMKLTEERLKYLGDRITGLDGLIDKASKYERIGYVPSHTNIRYVLKSLPLFSTSSKAVDLKKIPFHQLEEFDRHYFPAPRTNFLRCWINKNEGLGYLENQKLKGYGVIRKCNEGSKIGPLFAENFLIAKDLFESLCSFAKEGPIYLDIPEPNPSAQLLVKHYKMEPIFEVVRMYRNGTPQVDLSGTYGITSYELG
jgi:hypothetical protein